MPGFELGTPVALEWSFAIGLLPMVQTTYIFIYINYELPNEKWVLKITTK